MEEKFMKFSKQIITMLLVVFCMTLFITTPVNAASQSKTKNLPDGSKEYGKLTSNAWRTSGDGEKSGNTLQWDYQVSAVYEGDKTVERIRTTWQGSASLRYSASISLGISDSGVSADASSNWQTVKTFSKYWENDNGAKTSSWRSNMYVTPAKDYRKGTISIANTALVKLSCDARTFEITASV